MLKLQRLAADEEDGDQSLKVHKVRKVESRKSEGPFSVCNRQSAVGSHAKAIGKGSRQSPVGSPQSAVGSSEEIKSEELRIKNQSVRLQDCKTSFRQ